MQVTAAAFIAQGNMLVVSDRGDRLLFLTYHGLHPAKRCLLPWARPAPPLARAATAATGGGGGSGLDAPDGPDIHAPALEGDGAAGGIESGFPGASAHNDGAAAVGGRRWRRSGVCTVTSIVECPDVVGRCSEEWRSGISQLAVSSSRGDVVLLKI